MATYQELRARSQQVRDEQNIGGNTALRVGQLLMDIVKYFNDNDEAASEYLQQHFAMVNDGTQLLNWQQSPIVILHTMGEAYDDGDFSALSQGENYYRAGFIMEANGQGGGINGETPKANVLYVNLANDTLYTWNGSSFDAITSGGGGSISGDDIIKNAYYSNGNLVLIVETESGDKTVSIPVNFDASNYVPTSRTVNGKALSNNITLSQSDIPGLVAALAALVPQTRTINGKALSSNVTIGMNDIQGLVEAIANAGSGAVSVTTNQDGTFVIHVGSTDYTINLNHTHENMAKIVKCTEATLPQTLADDTIYVQVDNLTTPTEIEKLYLFGLEFTGGGIPDTGEPMISSPSNGSTINLGDNEGSGVSKTITIKGKNLTGDLTVTVSTGLTISYGQTLDGSSVTIPMAQALLGAKVTIAYSGSGALADGSLVISHGGSVLSSVVIVATNSYESLSAVKFNGQQWLQTNYYPNPNTQFELDCRFVKNSNTLNGQGSFTRFFLGCINDSKVFYFNNGAYLAEYGGTNKVFSLYCWTENPYTEGGQIYSHEYGTESNFCTRGTLVYANGTATFLGATIQTETKSTTNINKLCIGGKGDGNCYEIFDLEVYGFVIKENDAILHNFVPKSKDGVAGLYDTVTGDFLTSKTSVGLIGI